MVDELSAEEVAGRMKREPSQVVLLDVRDPWERELAVIEPSVHIPMSELPQRVRDLPKDRQIVVYCHAGLRSAMVAGYLEHLGFPSVSNLSGGIDAWSVEVDPAVPRYA